MSILSELYYGNICPTEKYLLKDGEYKKLLIKITDLMQKFTESLPDELHIIWNEINDMNSAMNNISDRESFIDGFCLGTKIMLEVIYHDHENHKI